MKNKLLTGFIMLALMACGSKKETGVPVYIEVEQMDPSLEKCFSEKLFGKWASLQDPIPHPNTEKYAGNPENKHIFKSYDDFDASIDTLGTEKVMVKVYRAENLDTTNSFFHIRRFELGPEGVWEETLNLGHFRLQDRPNDQINPGKIDEDEICEMMVKFCIKASFK
jgi:hypothetical protein